MKNESQYTGIILQYKSKKGKENKIQHMVILSIKGNKSEGQSGGME